MREVSELIQRCQELGIQLIASGNTLKIRANQTPPEGLLRAIKEAKEKIIAELCYRQRQEASNWLLEEWRKTSLPSWRRILRESIEQQDRRREEYARWMLREVLEDPEYKENLL
jgi:hypothetical protein